MECQLQTLAHLRRLKKQQIERSCHDEKLRELGKDYDHPILKAKNPQTK
jgi:hypothetical protein